jgi:hypothetical protein
MNILKVNSAKYQEIVFVDKRRKISSQPPSALPEIERVTSVKMLGVTKLFLVLLRKSSAIFLIKL